MDEDVMNLDLELQEDDLLCEDGLMLDMDVDEVQHALLNGKQEEQPSQKLPSSAASPTSDMHMEFLSCEDSGPLPPLDYDAMENDADLAALLADCSNSSSNMDQQQQLEKLARCMRQSEMTLKQQQSILAQARKAAAANSSASVAAEEENKCFAKADLFFSGHRATITPELEQSRQKVWSIIQQHSPVWTMNPPTTAAA